MNDMTPNELVAIEPANALTVFTTPNAIDPLLDRVRQEIDGFSADVTTDKGRKAIASMAYRVARAKTYLDDAGKALADQQKEIPKKIDACRKRIRDTLDKWRDEVRAPLTEWEEAEKTRIAEHKASIDILIGLANVDGCDAATIKRRLSQAEGFPITEEACEEFLSDYAAEKDAAIASLKRSLELREKHEAEQAELARLRAAEEQRKRQEHEARIAAEAAERAKREAEARAEAERKAAEDAARREREAAERRELELKLQAEAAERRAAEAEAKARREAEEKVKREAAEAERREQDKAHRSKINKAARDALMAGGLDQEAAEKAVTLIAQRSVPHVSIAY